MEELNGLEYWASDDNPTPHAICLTSDCVIDLEDNMKEIRERFEGNNQLGAGAFFSLIFHNLVIVQETEEDENDQLNCYVSLFHYEKNPFLSKLIKKIKLKRYPAQGFDEFIFLSCWALLDSFFIKKEIEDSKVVGLIICDLIWLIYVYTTEDDEEPELCSDTKIIKTALEETSIDDDFKLNAIKRICDRTEDGMIDVEGLFIEIFLKAHGLELDDFKKQIEAWGF